jgi:CHASE1-domain containing sensor protein
MVGAYTELSNQVRHRPTGGQARPPDPGAAQHATPQGDRTPRAGAPYVVLALTLLLTLAATYAFAMAAEARDLTRFRSAGDRIAAAIESRMTTYVAMLRAGAGFFAASDEVTRDEFRAYVKRLELESKYPGIQGIGFTRRVSRADLPAFEARMRAQGLPTFEVWPGSDRPEFHAIIYLEPLDRRNQAAIGYDMSTDATRR